MEGERRREPPKWRDLQKQTNKQKKWVYEMNWNEHAGVLKVGVSDLCPKKRLRDSWRPVVRAYFTEFWVFTLMGIQRSLSHLYSYYFNISILIFVTNECAGGGGVQVFQHKPLLQISFFMPQKIVTRRISLPKTCHFGMRIILSKRNQNLADLGKALFLPLNCLNLHWKKRPVPGRGITGGTFLPKKLICITVNFVFQTSPLRPCEQPASLCILNPHSFP